MSPALRIAIIGSARFGLREPYAGGLEAHTADLSFGLRRRGHEVTVYAGPDSDSSLGAVAMWPRRGPGMTAREDISTDPDDLLHEHMAYQRTVLRLMRAADVDVVHLNCCHHLPVAMAPLLHVPVTATLHCPVSPLLGLSWDHARLDGAPPTPVAVSHALARGWQPALGRTPDVIENAADLRLWHAGAGDGGYAVWCGRLVPEKAPHLAIDAARAAGLPIVLAGPRHDPAYWASELAPRLGPDVRVAGHLTRRQLAKLVGSATVALVTPVWDEPFGLVAVEALACGTPVAALARGALPDLIDEEVGALADPGDGDDGGDGGDGCGGDGETVTALAEAIRVAVTRDRRAVRRRAEQRFDLDQMVTSYEQLFARVYAGAPAGPWQPVARRLDRAALEPVA